MKALISTFEILGSGYRVAEVTSETFFVHEPALFWVDCPDECIPDLWFYDTNQKLCRVLAEDSVYKKAKALSLLQESDWASYPDVSNKLNSPYLANQNEFIEYRNQLRAIFTSSTEGPVIWPTIPVVKWELPA